MYSDWMQICTYIARLKITHSFNLHLLCMDWKAVYDSSANISLRRCWHWCMPTTETFVSMCCETITCDVCSHSSVILKSWNGAQRWPKRITSGCAVDLPLWQLDLSDCVLPKRTRPNKGGLISSQTSPPVCLLCSCHELCSVIPWNIFSPLKA